MYVLTLRKFIIHPSEFSSSEFETIEFDNFINPKTCFFFQNFDNDEDSKYFHGD